MTLILDLIIPGEPVAQPRAKATTIGGHARMYTPHTTGKGESKRSNGIAEYKALIKQIAAANYKGPLREDGLRVDCEFVFPRRRDMIWKKKPMPRAHCAVKPDRDNCDKAVLDALTGIVWRGDQQAVGGLIWRWYAAGDEQAHTRIRISTLDEYGDNTEAQVAQTLAVRQAVKELVD